MSISTFRDEVEKLIAAHEAKDKAGTDVKHEYGLVIYTDGGGDNNTQGPCGAGMHGYLFDAAIGKVISYLPSGQIATDYGYYDTTTVARKSDDENDLGATGCSSSIQIAGEKDAFGKKTVKLRRVQPIGYIDGTAYLGRPSTSNQAELKGVLIGLECTSSVVDLIKTVHFRLDSKYTISGVAQYLEQWKKNGWRTTTGEVKNPALWKAIDAAKEDLIIAVRNGDLQFSIEHVSGHAGFYGNEAADVLTHKGRVADVLVEPRVEVHSASTYFKASYSPNKFLHMPRWYYCTNDHQVIDGKTLHYIGRHGKEELDVAWGSRMSEQCCAVVLTDPDPVLEKLRLHYEEIGKGYKEDQIFLTHVDNVFKSTLYDDLMNNDLLYTKRSGKRRVATDKSTIFAHANPVNSAFVAFDNFKQIERKLMDFIHDRLPGNHALTDITDQIYATKVVKDKETRITLPDTDASLVVAARHRMKSDEEYQTHKVILTRGLDLPRRSMFLGIVDDDPKVYLLTWHESRAKIRYATIVKTNKGDIGIWLDLYSNQSIRGAKP